MRITFKQFWGLLKETASEWSEDNATRLGAALAYYTIFSLAPLLLIVLFVVGLIWVGQPNTGQAYILVEIEKMAGEEGVTLVRTMLESVQPGSGSVLAIVVGVGTLLFGATGVFAQLQGALNTIWEVRQKPERGLKGLVSTRLLSFGMVLVVGFLLLVSLVISALLSALDAFVTGITPWAAFFFQALNIVVSFGIITLLFAMIFRYLPDVEIDWRDVWIGAAITALLFTIGKFAIGLYLGQSSTASAYGAAGALVVLLLWVYYSALILFFGAEFTQVFACRYGSRIRPASYAVHVVERIGAVEEAAAPPAAREVASPAATHEPASALQRVMPIALAFLAGLWLARHR